MTNVIMLNKDDLRDLLREMLPSLSGGNNTPVEDDGKDVLIYGIKGLASFLDCSIPTAQKYKNEGMPCVQRGRKIIFKPADVWAFMDTRKRK
jgi:hypothetical protein